MQRRFKVGDIVTCVDAEDTDSGLVKGRDYIVSELSSTVLGNYISAERLRGQKTIRIKEFYGWTFAENRFELSIGAQIVALKSSVSNG